MAAKLYQYNVSQSQSILLDLDIFSINVRRILNVTLCFCWSSCFFADVDFTNHWNVLNVFTSSLPRLSSRWQIRLLCKFKPPVIAFPANFDVFQHVNMTVGAHKSTLKSLRKQGWLESGLFFDPGEQMWFSGVFIVTWWSFTDHLALFRWCSASAFKVKEWRWRAENRRRSQVTGVWCYILFLSSVFPTFLGFPDSESWFFWF